MKRFKKVLFVISVIAVISCIICQLAFAISEGEVQAQMDAAGREAVTGNVFIWFLCVVAFLIGQTQHAGACPSYRLQY